MKPKGGGAIPSELEKRIDKQAQIFADANKVLEKESVLGKK